MCLKDFYMIALLSAMYPFILGKHFPSLENAIDLKDGEQDSELTFPINSNSSENFEDYAVKEQDHGVSHLCIYEHWLKNEIIICDRHQASIFACIGAMEGEIKRCEKPIQNEIFVPVCLQEKTLEMITCKYKDIGGRNLCLPRTSTMNIFNGTHISYNTEPHIAFRVCKNTERFSCFNKGYIAFCNQLKVNQIKLRSEILDDLTHEETCNSSAPGSDCKVNNEESKMAPKYDKEKATSNLLVARTKETHNHVFKPVPVKKRKNKKQKTLTIVSSVKDSNKHSKEPYPKKAKNAYRYHEKNPYRTSRKRKHRKTSTADKNKPKHSHKVLKKRNYKKIANNYDFGRRDKNTTTSKYHILRNNNVGTEEQESYETGKVNVNTGSSKGNNINQYFHVLKCDDCTIDHVIKVEEDAYNVKVWTLPSN